VLLLPALLIAIDEFDWNRHRSFSGLVADLDSASSVRQSKAWLEIERRIAAAPISAENKALLFDCAFRQQEKRLPPPTVASFVQQEMVSFLGDCYRDGKLTAQQARRLFDNSLQSKIEVRQVVCAGDAIPYRISAAGCAPIGDWTVRG